MSAAAATANANAPGEAKPKSKKLLFIIIGVLVLALVGAGAAFFLLKKSHSADEGEGDPYADETHEPAKRPKHDPKSPPTFLPLEAMVVNLADEGGNRFAQLAITLQLDDPKVAEEMKVYMPSIRNAVLMLISQRTSAKILAVEGKQDLSQDIIAEISHIMGYEYEDPREEADAGEAASGKKSKRRRPVYNPIEGVLFSSFIVQ